MSEVPSVSTGDRLFAALQYVLPKHLLSRIIYAIARSESPFVKRTFLKIFLGLFDINMAEAVQPDPYAYRTFNDFFTRALKPSARPIAIEREFIVSPVDGTVSQCGELLNESILQAKGQAYSLQELLAGDVESVAAYRNGSFACIYLAPYNYHRIHMPYAGTALKNIYVPGDLFSVNASTARAVPRVFARNERLICEFNTPVGRVAVILVGALHVGSIETVHCGEVNPPPRRRKQPEIIAAGIGHQFAKGDELGRFNMGSTVVLLFERGRIHWDDSMKPNAIVQLGRPIARTVQ
jgi:phosphatidylserine decarboxylase